ncbi:MAG: S9 family peptidase [Bacteroidota bacterium]
MNKFFFYTLLLLALTSPSAAQQQKKDISPEDIWKSGTFAMDYFFPPESMNDGIHYSQLDYNDNLGEIVKYSYKTGKAVATIVKGSELTPSDMVGKAKPFRIEGYRFSPDETKILIWNETEQIYRHSTREIYYVYDIKTKKNTLLSDYGKQSYARFSPDGKKVAFVRENNIFYKDLSSGNEVQVTFDGKINHIINGAVDWVYEEEFSMDAGFQWSPDGNRIAYYRFDESMVKEFSMTMFRGELYPAEYKYKYPKAGEENSTVSIHCYDVKLNQSHMLPLGTGKDDYIPRIKWTSDPAVLSIQKMNRLQNKLELVLVNFSKAPQGEPKTLMTEESKTYIEISDHLTFLADKKHYIWSSEKDGFFHLYLYDMTGKQVNQITKGNWDIAGFYGVDEAKKLVYYTSAEASPMERELFSVKLDGSGKKKLSAKKGTNTPYFSTGFKYYINSHSDANTPPAVTLHSADGKLIRTLLDNVQLKDKMKDYNIAKKEFFKFKTSEGVELNGWMMKPWNFDAGKKYPVFMTVYGGPGANTVNDAWDGRGYFWHQLLTQKGYIVVSVDNRGTGYRGYEFKHCTYKQLGKLEVADQIEAAKYLGAQPYVDKARIGIFGWSYGGYMSSLCITKGADFFRMAIAVAPVTNWRYYDSIYTERYNGLPQDNPSGYDDNSPIHFVKSLKGKYLLIHGTADDNVHFQNAAEMQSALVKAGKQFDSFYYPDKNHGMWGAHYHLYTMMTNYILGNL